MRLSFSIRKFEQGWAFVFGDNMPVVIGIGRDNQRYFETHEAIVSKLEGLGILPNQYEDLEAK